MPRKHDPKASKPKTLRVEGAAPISRLQELLHREPELTLEVVAPRLDSRRATQHRT
jgi:hypothetical protein